MINQFKENFYITDRKQTPLKKIILNKEFHFYKGIFKTLNNSRKIAMKGLYNDEQWVISSQKIIQVIEEIGGSFNIEGLENIHNNKGPFIFAANHMSTLETFVLPALIQPYHPTTFVVKRSLAESKIIGPTIIARPYISVDRNNPIEDLRKVLSEGKKILEGGRSIIIFPQSTRTTDFSLTLFNSIAARLAIESNKPIIPIALKTDFWGNGKGIFSYVGKIHPEKTIYFSFSKPIYPQIKKRELQQETLNFISSKLRGWGTAVKE